MTKPPARATVSATAPRDLQAVPLWMHAAFPVAGVVSIVSLVGIFSTNFYARETANWQAQAIGQDWADLLIAVPWLVSAGAFAARGSRRASLVLAAGLLYIFYEFVIYGFALHFNVLFLPYCAVLGACFFSLSALGLHYARERVDHWYSPETPVRVPGVVLLGVGVSFAFAWLSEVVTALVSGTIPASIADAGTVTNPVFLIDLSVVLPAHLIAGVSILRRRPMGLWLAPILLGFDVLMALSLAAMMWIVGQRGQPTSQAVAFAMLGLALVSGLTLGRLLRGLGSTAE